MCAFRVLVDADACPRQVLAIAEKLCADKGWACITYASYNHVRTGKHHVVVDASPQAVDIRLANDAEAGDIVITQDIGLAALALSKKARAVSVYGTIFHAEMIAFQLEERNEKERFRRAGGRTKGHAARSAEDDRKFAEALERLMEGR